MADKIEELRKTARIKNISNKYIAEKLGVSVNTVSRWFRGHYHPTYEHLEKMEKLLGVAKSEDEAQGNKNLRFTDIIDSKMEYQFNKYGFLRVWLDGKLIWKTSDDSILREEPIVRRTCRLSGGGVGKYLAEALCKGLSVIQDGESSPRKPELT